MNNVEPLFIQVNINDPNGLRTVPNVTVFWNLDSSDHPIFPSEENDLISDGKAFYGVVT